ncbi:MAG: FAD-binding protein [Phycisphaerae bacterium]|nr:FAD-binding protein [Phycisphaerae bacterium]
MPGNLIASQPVTSAVDSGVAAALNDIRLEIAGDLRADQLSRAIYATDASIYEIVPDAVALPRTVDEVRSIVRVCDRHSVPITPRGGGTGLAGGAVNRGLILDLSRHMNRILAIDPARRIARVEPGVVLDELNAQLRQHGLLFAPDVATSSRATIGGMIANNSCGAHSVLYGRTVDHVIALDVVLADGTLATWGKPEWEDRAASRAGRDADRRLLIEQTIKEVSSEYADEISARFPRVLRRNGGYALDRLRTAAEGRVNPETIICGSEGTLGVVVGAVLNLVPLPKHRGIVAAHFADLLDALYATPSALMHGPAAVELLDKLILDAARVNPVMSRRRWLIDGDPGALLIIELYDDDAARLASRLEAVAADLRSRGMGYAWPILTDAARQDELWFIRKSGLGLLMSKPGDRQTYDFVEDTAVDPSRLRDYIARFMQVLADEGVPEASYYAHASVGCLHVKPILNLKCADDIARMHRIADRISSLALEFNGTMTGEHGDGILRSEWLQKMYGPRIIEAFRRIKSAFDPKRLLNPGKIVDPYPMIGQFRYGPDYRAATVETVLDFSEFGGMAGMAEMCSGVGQCRQRLVGTMCPSYMATGDEQHTTRARANALRLALSNRPVLGDLDDPALDDAMDLCLSCKACKSECPTGVDMAKLKAEWLHRRNQREGPSLRSRLIARIGGIARIGSVFPSLTNALSGSDLTRALLERFFGIDRRVPPPRFAARTFRQWFAGRSNPVNRPVPDRRHFTESPADINAGSQSVIYYVDTWTNHFTPQVGIATVTVLEALGYRVWVPPTVCCGRPAISKGMLDIASQQALSNVESLAPLVARGASIVVTEPSCLSAMIDEWPQLVRTEQARAIASCAQSAESFVVRHLRANHGAAPRNSPLAMPIRLHGHCHQKALGGTADTLALLQLIADGRASEINSGCCGMAGSFGHEKEHYDTARAVGEQRLFPAVRDRGDSTVAVTGFSCRHQIEHHTGVHVRHVMELAADAFVR